MKYKKSIAKELRQRLLSAVNKAIPKTAQVLVLGFPNVESSAIETANYIATHYNYPVTYVVSTKLKDDPRALLSPKVKVLTSDGSLKNRFQYFRAIFRSKYLFMTHGIFLSNFSDSQVITNIWHGILYKKIGMLIGGRAMPADVTVGTSPLTVKMFAQAFGVNENSVYVSGYPRNDQLLKAKAGKERIREQLKAEVGNQGKLLIWLPTFRKNTFKTAWEDGAEAGNPFYIPDFDVLAFHRILEAQDAFCLVKPHPMAVKYAGNADLSHLMFIDDQWISDRKLTLYQLLGATDLLISDVSSVVIDYLLMDQPILCVSTDFVAYQNSRGFYFDDIENWLPGKVLDSEAAFFEALQWQLRQLRQKGEEEKLAEKEKVAEGVKREVAENGERKEVGVEKVAENKNRKEETKEIEKLADGGKVKVEKEGAADEEAARRMALKKAFFTYTDARSTERLVEHVFNLKK